MKNKREPILNHVFRLDTDINPSSVTLQKALANSNLTDNRERYHKELHLAMGLEGMTKD